MKLSKNGKRTIATLISIVGFFFMLKGLTFETCREMYRVMYIGIMFLVLGLGGMSLCD